MSLEQMYERSLKYDETKFDVMTYVADARFTPHGLAVPANLVNGRVVLPLTDWALGQACTKMGDPPASYMKRCPDYLQAKNLEYWRTRLVNANQEKQWLVRAHQDKARAVLSETYSPFSNTDMLRYIMEYVEGNYRLVRPYITPDTLHVKILFPALDRVTNGDYGFGVYLGNGEIGNRYIRALPVIQRTACDNSIIIRDHETFKPIMHRFKSQAFMKASVKQGILEGLQLSVERIDAVWKAAEEEIPNMTTVIKNIARAKGFSEEVEANIILGTEGQETRMGLVNGLSFAANRQNDHELMVDMEVLAGSILVGSDTLFGRAARIAQEESVEVEA